MSLLPTLGGASLPPSCFSHRASPVGFVTSALSAEDSQELAALASQILDDPVALRRLSDRVFELLKQDLQQEQERRGGYGRRAGS